MKAVITIIWIVVVSASAKEINRGLAADLNNDVTGINC